MDPTQWLEQSARGFAQLSTLERKAIGEFMLLWSHYEAEALHTEGNANAIVHAVKLLREQEKLTLEPFRPPIEHFSNRYYDGTKLTSAFDELRLKVNAHKTLVESVVRGQSSDEVEILSAILIIVLRLRNNLFHGTKWSYGLQGQYQNFCSANNVLMTVIDLHRSCVKPAQPVCDGFPQ
jgi:hypothetical protein